MCSNNDKIPMAVCVCDKTIYIRKLMIYINTVKILILLFIYKKCKEYKIALVKFPVLLFGGRAF